MYLLRQSRTMISIDLIRPRLRPISETRWDSSPAARQASVLVPLILQPDAEQLLFTQRSGNLSDHPGQIAFPGGARDAQDSSPADTALRETEEEIGVHAQSIRLVGSLDPIRTSSGFSVTPIVGVMIWPVPLQLDSIEVDSVFTIPLAWFNGTGKMMLQDGCPTSYSLHFPAHAGHEVWGATAMITLDLINRIFPRENK
jgi:8-oxo-dGTP pyrophosphatase MutT (NUDIX family)